MVVRRCFLKSLFASHCCSSHSRHASGCDWGLDVRLVKARVGFGLACGCPRIEAAWVPCRRLQLKRQPLRVNPCVLAMAPASSSLYRLDSVHADADEALRTAWTKRDEKALVAALGHVLSRPLSLLAVDGKILFEVLAAEELDPLKSLQDLTLAEESRESFTRALSMCDPKSTSPATASTITCVKKEILLSFKAQQNLAARADQRKLLMMRVHLGCKDVVLRIYMRPRPLQKCKTQPRPNSPKSNPKLTCILPPGRMVWMRSLAHPLQTLSEGLACASR